MQKRLAFYCIAFLLFAGDLYGQMNASLCKKDEEIVFAFQLSNKKWVAVCKEKAERYIVYRFGTSPKVELQFPAVLDSTSWQQFSFKGYSRGGGIQNSAMNVAFLNFTNNNVNYEVYDTWTAEEDKPHIGVTITIEKKTIDLKGNIKSRKGYLLSLSDNQKIKQEED